MSYSAPVASGLPLAPLELDTLRAAATGMTVEETGQVLHYAPGTVKDWRRSLIDKLGARNITQAVNVAHERGVLGPPADPAE
jgi:DNA-binding CsgD family transcriptional regulator